MSIFHKAPHPSAAKAFIDFFLDDESMNIMAKAGEFVNRKGVYPPVPDADKIKFVEMDDLGEIFLRRETQRVPEAISLIMMIRPSTPLLQHSNFVFVCSCS